MKKNTIALIFGVFFSWACVCAQTTTPSLSRTPAKVQSIYNQLGDSVMNMFKKVGISGIPTSLYLRSFKFDRELEVWVKDPSTDKYKLLKTYRVCQQSGTMGPKRVEGDYQVPEGFYYVNEFNPNSNFHLSLGLNYPNASDQILSDQRRPGSAIYIHGNCVSTGCLPITDKMIEELFTIARMVRDQGQQEFIPVHIFPVRYTNKESMEYLETMYKQAPNLVTFNNGIKPVFDYFETNRKLPLIMVNAKGEYLLN